MDALIKKVSEAAGINSDQAKIAIETVATSLKEKLPPFMHTQIDTLVNDGTLTDAMKKQMHEFTDRTEAVIDEMKKRATEVSNEMKAKFDELFKK